MGYYNGNGVVTGGSESGRTLKSFYEWGAFAIRQRCISTLRKYSGVSLDRARSFHNEDNLTAVSGGSGTLAWIIFDAEGTRKTVAYSRIGDSNLFDLTVTEESYSAYKSSSTTRNMN